VKIDIHFEPLTLGEFTALLRGRPSDQTVRYDFCYMIPTTFDSYRGYYNQLALGHCELDYKTNEITVEELLKRAVAADGKVFEGYKGGQYTMGPYTRLWVANYGHVGSTAIVGLAHSDYMTVIQTAWCDS
jgi:hypothetical protein